MTKLTGQNSIHLLTAKNIVRPQTYFKDKVDNGNIHPWKPRITEKPNSLKPLALHLEPNEEFEEFDEWSHPYEFELEHFKVPEVFLADIKEPSAVESVNNTPLHEITTEEQLDELVEELRKHKEIAIDLEHHSYRTFQGITCLLQISTRKADYLVDTLSLRHKLYVLNEVFTKPSILKVNSLFSFIIRSIIYSFNFLLRFFTVLIWIYSGCNAIYRCTLLICLIRIKRRKR